MKDRIVTIWKTTTDSGTLEYGYLSWNIALWGWVSRRARGNATLVTEAEATRLAQWVNLCWPDTTAKVEIR